MTELTQADFDFLMGIEKEFEDKSTIFLGPAPLQWSRKIKATATHDTFLLDFYRGSFRIQKYTFNHRYRQTFSVFRYDSYGVHTNPDGQVVDVPHVHLYKEGYGDKFAYPASEFGIEESDPMEEVLRKILVYCKIKWIAIEVPIM